MLKTDEFSGGNYLSVRGLRRLSSKGLKSRVAQSFSQTAHRFSSTGIASMPALPG